MKNVANAQKTTPGDETFQDLLGALATSLLYVDYGLTYAAVTGSTITELKFSSNIIGAIDDNPEEFADLKSNSAVRKWYDNAKAMAYVAKQTGAKAAEVKKGFFTEEK
jgi:hypothetical protein